MLALTLSMNEEVPSTVGFWSSYLVTVVTSQAMNNLKCCKNKREETLDLLRKRREIKWDNHNIFHGRLKHFLPSCAPVVSWECPKPPEKGRLPASELLDQRDILHEKVGFVVKLMTESRHTTLYTGAGVSSSAGVQQVAKGSRRRLRRPHTTNAKVRSNSKSRSNVSILQPNYSNVALAEIVRAGCAQDWVTTNWDGLAQKAGCPQATVIEISGSWFDPTNPVLKRRDKARSDLQERAESLGRDTDLVLVLGSSLTPSPGAFLPQAVARRGLGGECLGPVIVGLQQTPLDSLATIRIFSDMDTFLKLLLDKLKLSVCFSLDMGRHIVHRARVPYDAAGERSREEETLLDLGQGREVVTWGGRGGRVIRYCSTQTAWQLEIQGEEHLLGWWWMAQVRTVSVTSSEPFCCRPGRGKLTSFQLQTSLPPRLENVTSTTRKFTIADKI